MLLADIRHIPFLPDQSIVFPKNSTVFRDLFHQFIEPFGVTDLRAVTEGRFRIVVNLNHQSVRACRDGCQSQRFHHPSVFQPHDSDR